MKTKIIIKNKSSTTNLVIKNNYLNNYIKNLKSKNKKIFCIVDKKVKRIIKNFERSKNFKIIYVKGNENIKNINFYSKICDKLISNKVDRKSLLLVIGGGTTGDLGGFIASTILRGIDLVLIPTTLLSQVDSAIGGKNGINTFNGKNLIGTFYQPNEIIIDPSVLKTLSLREIKAGYSEIVKHAIIKDDKFFDWLDKNYKKILSLDAKILEQAIFKSIMIKMWYINRDTKEELVNKKSRATLNFGHTIGHALESFYKYKFLNHGEAISIGMITEAKISNKLGFLSNYNLEKIINHFKKVNLKLLDKNLKNNKIKKIILNDKKNLNNEINMIMLKKIGNSFFSRNVDIKKIMNIIKNS